MTNAPYPLWESLKAKAGGREPYAGWADIIRFCLISRLVRWRKEQERKLYGDRHPLPKGWTRREVDDLIHYQHPDFSFYWPAAFSGSDPLSQMHCIFTGNPHSYFDLYQPRDGEVIFDLGACEGFFPLALLKKAAGLKIYAFEPLPQLCAALERTLADSSADGTVEIHPLAFADRAGQTTLNVEDQFAYMANIIHQPAEEAAGGADRSGPDQDRRLSITTTTVDAFVAEHNLPKLDLIKMDIEGAEPDTLRGAVETMRRLKPRILACTYHAPEHFTELTEFFREHSYQVRPTKGVMSTEGDYGPRPHFRKGVILAQPLEE